jgi:hypothetical protein
MKLCFGTYAKVLTLFRKDGVTRKDLLNTTVQAVDLICKLSDNAVNRLLNCESNLPNGRSNGLGNVRDNALKADAQAVAEYFAAKLPDMLNAVNRKFIILALLDIISSDDTIISDTIVDKASGTTKDVLRKQTRFAMSDFLAGVDNKFLEADPGKITKAYAENFLNRIDTIDFIVTKRKGDKISADEAFLDYQISAKAKYGNIKTLLYKNEPKPFYDFYVLNIVEQVFG